MAWKLRYTVEPHWSKASFTASVDVESAEDALERSQMIIAKSKKSGSNTVANFLVYKDDFPYAAIVRGQLFWNKTFRAMEKNEQNFIVCYNNGRVVRQTRINGDYLFQIEIGAIRHIIKLNQNTITHLGEDGIAKESKLQTFHNP